MRAIRYQEIAEDLRRRVGAGEFDASRLLPSESELSESYSASRVTIRRSLEVLRSEGLVESRQGYGWLVAGEPLSQNLSRLETIEAQLVGAGIVSERRILQFEYGTASAAVADVLGCRSVLTVRRLNLADNVPFGLVTVWCPERLAAPLSKSSLEESSFLEQLGVEVLGATQTISAGLVAGEDARLLEVPDGSPVLIAERVTRGTGREPILMSEHIIPAHRSRFEVELSVDDTSSFSGGLQLVDDQES